MKWEDPKRTFVREFSQRWWAIPPILIAIWLSKSDVADALGFFWGRMFS